MTRNKNNARNKDARRRARETGVSFAQARREVAPETPTPPYTETPTVAYIKKTKLEGPFLRPVRSEPVLLLDLDSQSNTTSDMGFVPEPAAEPRPVDQGATSLRSAHRAWSGKDARPVPPRRGQGTLSPEIWELMLSKLPPPTLITEDDADSGEHAEVEDRSSWRGGLGKTHAAHPLPLDVILDADGAHTDELHIEADPARLREAIGLAARQYDHVFIDVPPGPAPLRTRPGRARRAQDAIMWDRLLRLAREAGWIDAPAAENG